MIGLLDLIEDHRAAVKYDLLKHGYRLEWLGSDRLPWGDAIAIIGMQPPATSALYRELHPDDFDRGAVTQRLDQMGELLKVLAVFLQRGQMLLGNQSEVAESTLPTTFDDLFDAPKPQVEQRHLWTIEDIDRLMGWDQPNEVTDGS